METGIAAMRRLGIAKRQKARYTAFMAHTSPAGLVEFVALCADGISQDAVGQQIVIGAVPFDELKKVIDEEL